MRISEMDMDKATQVMAEITEPVGRICDDEEIVGLIKELDTVKGVSAIQAFGKMLPKFVNVALIKHKSDVYKIIGLLSEKADVGKMKLGEVITVIRENYEDLSGFFTRS